ncbi:hypothetical protein HanPI659440_Chr09g0321171 [Helianthus annuus]|nr:hypothetical protein HanPI659440_Chr09g0321171 [Helianthus annuus]
MRLRYCCAAKARWEFEEKEGDEQYEQKGQMKIAVLLFENLCT